MVEPWKMICGAIVSILVRSGTSLLFSFNPVSSIELFLPHVGLFGR